MFKMAINTYLSIITLNVNGLNILIERNSGRLKKKKVYNMLPTRETHSRAKDIHRFKVRKWKNIFHANENKKAGVAIFILDKTDFKTKSIKKDTI